PQCCWALGEHGYQLAERQMSRPIRRPLKDVGAAFLEHTLDLNQLYCDMARLESREGSARAPRTFRWVSSESSTLPWTEIDDRGTHRPRRIAPDARIDAPVQRLRFFLEYETGSQPITSLASNGSSVMKLRRYGEFISGVGDAGRPFYQLAFPDSWRAELLFVVATTA